MKFKPIFSGLLVSSILLYLLLTVAKNFETITKFHWHLDVYSVSLLIAFLLPVYLINALSWHFSNLSLGSNYAFVQNLQVWMYSNLGRFLPGAIWQYAGRVYLASEIGIPKTITMSALIVEAIFNLSAGALIVVIFVIYSKLRIADGILPISMLLLLFLFSTVVVLGNGSFLGILTRIISKLFKFKGVKVRPLSMKWTPVLLCSYLLQFIFGGTILFLLTSMAVDLPASFYLTFIGIYAFSWLVGYITIFSPSGLGVQELSIAGLLSGYLPFSVAIVVAIFFRVLLIISELVTISGLYFLKNHFLPKSRKR